MAVQLPKTIRQWFTPEQACVYLSQVFNEDFTTEDLFYFCFAFPPMELEAHLYLENGGYTEWHEPNITNRYFLNEFVKQKNIKNSEVLERFFLPFGHYPIVSRGDTYENYFQVFICIDNFDSVEYKVKNTSEVMRFKNSDECSVFGLTSIYCEFTAIGFKRSDLDRFIKAQMGENNKNTQTTTRPTPISSQHRENLLRRIKAEGLDALQLTAGKGGKSGSKAQIKALLVPNIMTNSQFEKTWESAMRDQVIQYKP